MTNKFVSVMEKVGHDLKIVFIDVEKELPLATTLAAAIFPANATAAGVIASIQLVQQTVVLVEQKFAAAGAPTGSGAQKLAQVLAIVGPAVTQLLAQEGIKVDQTEVTNIVNAVVADLNAQPAAA